MPFLAFVAGAVWFSLNASGGGVGTAGVSVIAPMRRARCPAGISVASVVLVGSGKASTLQIRPLSFTWWGFPLLGGYCSDDNEKHASTTAN